MVAEIVVGHDEALLKCRVQADTISATILDASRVSKVEEDLVLGKQDVCLDAGTNERDDIRQGPVVSVGRWYKLMSFK